MTSAQSHTRGEPSSRQARLLAQEMESALLAHPEVTDCAVRYRGPADAQEDPTRRCTACGISTRYPGLSFDEEGVCGLCLMYEDERDRIHAYFGVPGTLAERLRSASEGRETSYDCLLLFSGGKDSTYVLYQLVSMGLRVMTFTFDNGFISRAALRNVERVTSALGVEHVTATHDDQERVFLESLNEHKSVCNGCFRSLLELSTRLAHERGIPSIVTGLSRGQIIDERLSWFHSRGVFDPEEIESGLRLGRTAYHRGEVGPEVLASVEVVDFFRYSDVTKDDIRDFLKLRSPMWSEPTDTGFCSSNCMINDVGVYVHTRERGFHNYESPTRWEVRLGHLARDEADSELRAPVNIARVKRMLARLGYADPESREGLEQRFTGYVVTRGATAGRIRSSISTGAESPPLPGRLVRVADIPRPRGAVDEHALELSPVLDGGPTTETSVPPRGHEELVPVLPAQQRLLALADGRSGMGGYAGALLLELRNADADMVRRPLLGLVLQHEALRLRFVRERDKWLQGDGGAERALTVARLDLSSYDVGEEPGLLSRALRRMRSRADASEGPRVQATVVKRGDRPPLLLLVVHALSADPGSWRTLLTDLRALWEGGGTPATPRSFLTEAELRTASTPSGPRAVGHAPHVLAASSVLAGGGHDLGKLCRALADAFSDLFPGGPAVDLVDHTARGQGIVGPLAEPLRMVPAHRDTPSGAEESVPAVRLDHLGPSGAFALENGPFGLAALEGTGLTGPGGPGHPVTVTASSTSGALRLAWWCDPALRDGFSAADVPARLLRAVEKEG
ncbi:condensation domain-containing protein [Nocardiopsis quinghaiensis]|uniref:condensation domain-containing protein n=1 Tax=Nocardiopsis quinghaiensis TaxID=464995 RepID=UPI00123A72D7|nr:condensation domain-containing protein [Nocardiopsis quinghaiensis]